MREQRLIYLLWGHLARQRGAGPGTFVIQDQISPLWGVCACSSGLRLVQALLVSFFPLGCLPALSEIGRRISSHGPALPLTTLSTFEVLCRDSCHLYQSTNEIPLGEVSIFKSNKSSQHLILYILSSCPSGRPKSNLEFTGSSEFSAQVSHSWGAGSWLSPPPQLLSDSLSPSVASCACA